MPLNFKKLFANFWKSRYGTLASGECLALDQGSLVGRGDACVVSTGLGGDVVGVDELGGIVVAFVGSQGQSDHKMGDESRT